MPIGDRTWVPDPRVIADQLIEDYREAKHEYDADDRAMRTLATETDRAQLAGEEFQENDWIVLVKELARRAAGIENDSWPGGEIEVPTGVSEEEAVRAVKQQFSDVGMECSDDEARRIVRTAWDQQ